MSCDCSVCPPRRLLRRPGFERSRRRASGHGLVVTLRSALAALLAVLTLAGTGAADPYVDAVRSFSEGQWAGWGSEFLPEIVLGPPEGGGLLAGSTHVLSLGDGGTVTVVFRDNLVVDGPGDDLVVFENAFHSGSENGPIFDELAFVEVSADGREYRRFPHDAASKQGLAGQIPVLANSANGLDPLAPESGGDRFDIADLGLSFVRFLRLVDVDGQIADLGDVTFPGTKGGFDLDAAGALNSMRPGRVVGTLSLSGQALAGVKVKLIPVPRTRKWRRRTRADGGFAFRRVIPSGDYLIRARIKGLGRRERPVFIGLDQLDAEVHLSFD